jgi:multicomponent Na+:H+ antiporter subunit G
MIAAAVEFAIAALGAVVVALGLLILLGGALGVLRFPDFYTRMHAATAADSLGAVLVAAGLAIVAPNPEVSARLTLMALLIAVVGAYGSYLSGNAAYTGGLAPLTGLYSAPRPARRDGA